MIQVSEQAQQEVRRLLAAAGKPQGGLRISITRNPPCGLRITIAHGQPGRKPRSVDVTIEDAPMGADRIQNMRGVRLFLDPQALRVVEGGELVVRGGELELVLPARAATAA